MNLTQTEVLTVLQEECAEVIQAVSKIFRHGEESNWGGRLPNTNLDNLKREVADLTLLITLTMFAYDIKREELVDFTARKIENLQKFSMIFKHCAEEYSEEQFLEFMRGMLPSDVVPTPEKKPRKRAAKKAEDE